MVVLIGILSCLAGVGIGVLIYWLITRKEQGDPVIRKMYYDDGGLKASCMYIGGLKSGVENLYYPSGQLNATRNWNEGVLDGDFVVNYPEGQCYITGTYQNGELQGSYIVYDLDGNIKERKDY